MSRKIGVTTVGGASKFHTHILLNQRSVFLGDFDTAGEARAAYDAAKKVLAVVVEIVGVELGVGLGVELVVETTTVVTSWRGPSVDQKGGAK